MRLAFLTGTPLNVSLGSGTFTGISTLAKALGSLGHEVRFFTPQLRLPVFTAERLLFNEQLRRERFDSFDAVVGFDMDGYRLGMPHIAAIKGVIADEMRFESGATRWMLGIQARCERAHVERASTVITTSRYAAARIRELYGREASVVPECIDLERWRELLAAAPVPPHTDRFTVLCVCRFYPRKRVDLLLRAAALLPGIDVRIVGGGPQEHALRRLAHSLGLGDRVRWLGTVSQEALAAEYNACDAFCLPSVQEGFGIVFLEAMAAGKAIVAARAAAVPEVVTDGILTEPESAEAIARAIAELRATPVLRASLEEAGLRTVRQWDSCCIAARFLEALRGRAAKAATASATGSNRSPC